MFAVAAASEPVGAAAGGAGASAAAPASSLICADDAADADVAGELAAIAAAAIASGAGALPAAGVAAGISAGAMVTGITTATTFGIVTVGPPCCAETAGTVEESAAEICSEEDFLADSRTPTFKALNFAPDRWTASASALALALVSALASESRLAVVSRSSEFFRAAWSAAVASRDRALSAAVADASSERRCVADCGCAGEVARSLLVSAGVLLWLRRPAR